MCKLSFFVMTFLIALAAGQHANAFQAQFHPALAIIRPYAIKVLSPMFENKPHSGVGADVPYQKLLFRGNFFIS